MHVARKHVLAHSFRWMKLSVRYESTTVATNDKRIKQRTARPPRNTIFSGIQPTGIPHLGNYLGALRQWKDLQEEKDRKHHHCFFSIVDLHALTLKQNPQDLLRWRSETLASLLAIGLSPAKSVIFVQSEVPFHTELMWILSTIASTGYLTRMTQWKSKLKLSDDASFDSQGARDNLKLGLFSYPVLQAADILLYRASLVPVGEDQSQHIEFARDLASRFNHLYSQDGKEILRIPKAIISPAKRIMSLKSPSDKMSKSDTNPSSRILITDSSETIHAKIKTALTDSKTGISYDLDGRPGVSNLLDILKHTSRSEHTCEELAADMQSTSMKAFKERVADEVVKCLSGVREKFETLMQTPAGGRELEAVRLEGKKRAMAKGGRVMQDVRVAIGLEHSREVSRAEPEHEEVEAKDDEHSTGISIASGRRRHIGLDSGFSE